jgi:hypothetical protein
LLVRAPKITWALATIVSPASGILRGFIWCAADSGYQDPKTAMLQDTLKKPERWGDLRRNDHQRHSSWDANASPMNGDDKATADMGAIHRHFHSLERQHLSMMEMLQVNFEVPVYHICLVG